LLNVVHLMGQTTRPYPAGLFGGPPCCWITPNGNFSLPPYKRSKNFILDLFWCYNSMGLKFRNFIYIVTLLNISINTDVTFLSVFYNFRWGLMQCILQQQIYLK